MPVSFAVLVTKYCKMEKLDLTKKHKSYYTSKAKPEIVEIEPARYLSINGKGDPSGDTFSRKIQALYATAYAIKFTFKSAGKDFIVSKLEGLWWFDENKYSGLSMVDASVKVPRNEWEYLLLIRIPDFINKQDVLNGIETTLSKKQLTLAKGIEYYEMAEGKCAQVLHIGPFSKEPETLTLLDEFMHTNKLKKNGLHHEIYLSDFRSTPPEKLKTILREPVRKNN